MSVLQPSQPQPSQIVAQPGVSLSGSEIIKLLEIGTASSLNDFGNHFYTLSALLPLANLNSRQQRVIIAAAQAEAAMLKKAGFNDTQAQLKLIEFVCSVLGQSSRALGGQERKELTTTRAMVNTPQAQQAGGLSGLLQRLKG